MKVLFNARPAEFQKGVSGGAAVQLLKTKERLEKLGIKAKGFDPFNDNLEDYDIFHNFGMEIDSYMLFDVAKKLGVKTALSPIYWKPEDMIMHGNKPGRLRQMLIEKISSFDFSLQPSYFYKCSYKGFLNNADIILPNSNMEMELISKRFGINKKKFFVVPNGADKKFYNAKADLFVKKYRLRDFVLFVGRIDPRKNVLALIRAAKSLKLPLVIIGGTQYNLKDYMEKCKEEARGGKIYFLGDMQNNSEMLRSAYAAAKVLALPSWFETPGLAALEGGLAGCNLAISNGGSTTEYFKKYADYCEPSSIDSIKESLQRAFEKEKSNELRDYILKNFTWEIAAKKTLEAYRKII